ncbi:MOSC domain-containing protein [Salipaludibacillus sp. CUR1]|uniref:MOSC domain-containing protein n=1 Tax=Salipaludibacillus sp. CUR1 TaxID=2820003 RepID=UPI001E50058D|nr:MOSC domain-containing protein [Salipaludibacillus sp. CUR1]MCE7791925.1 MOSC domain-containing protein [Salipaludibacillus sp. CUR1]
MAGELRAIWIKRMARGPMDPVDKGTLIENRGLHTNKDQGGKRQVTLIDENVWSELMDQLNADLDPSARRANLMLKGINLEKSRGRHLQIGRTMIKIYGETKPCERMDEALPGLKDAMYENWKGGAYGVVVKGGEISTGDKAEWVEI